MEWKMVVLPGNGHQEAADKLFIFSHSSLVFSKLWNLVIPGLICAHPLPAGASLSDDHVSCISSKLKPKALKGVVMYFLLALFCSLQSNLVLLLPLKEDDLHQVQFPYVLINYFWQA